LELNDSKLSKIITALKIILKTHSKTLVDKIIESLLKTP